ncbi:hypothetical protein HC028_22720 [Planosporangium flavigriseum]|uniref:Uncharacterized protein n=1 Tax=Planosporangium flavigriseum TaxID=373681 RepID=A0A8J3PNV0_9ACTN|nr:hypothetical protein [Planosporangium flavigriseum]NJC67293.1 hypothetical protein [Planosporangium flavigriseum]GIG75258.1 hypothetical protein Pfl04_36620 [Planosporangium flavigriseum]
MDREGAGRGYLEHLTDADLEVLSAWIGMDTERAGELRGQPETVLDLFDHPELFDRVYGPDPAGLIGISPFFTFLVAVEQAAREISVAPFLAERSAPRQRVPVFDAPRLRDFLIDPMRRLFLAELLASFVRVASGRYWTRTARGWRSQRYSELDPLRLAQLAEQTPRAYRPGAYRRLGDVSLFLTGVFPDYAQLYAFGPFDTARLLRATGLAQDDESGLLTAPPIQLLEHLGQRWYRLASELAPVATAQLAVVSQVADRFRDARRILNHIADHHFSRVDNPWFGPPGS